MLVFATGRPIISVGGSGTTLPCPGLAVSSAATTTPLRSGNVLGISVPQPVWSLLPAASRGVVALAVPEGASGWGMLHSGDLPATSGEFDNIEEPGQDKEGLLLEIGASGTFRPAASSVEVPEEVWRLLPEEDRGVVNFMVPATTEDEVCSVQSDPFPSHIYYAGSYHHLMFCFTTAPTRMRSTSSMG